MSLVSPIIAFCPLGFSDWFMDGHMSHTRLMRCNLWLLLQVVGKRSSLSITVAQLWGHKCKALISTKEDPSEKAVSVGKMLEGSSHTQTQKQTLTALEHFDPAIPEAKHSCALITSVSKAPPLLFVCLSQSGLSFVTKKFMTITSPIYLDCYKMFHMCHFTLILKTYLFIR